MITTVWITYTGCRIWICIPAYSHLNMFHLRVDTLTYLNNVHTGFDTGLQTFRLYILQILKYKLVAVERMVEDKNIKWPLTTVIIMILINLFYVFILHFDIYKIATSIIVFKTDYLRPHIGHCNKYTNFFLMSLEH